MTRQNFPNILYASKEKINSASKLVIFDDRGTLDISSGGLKFSGKKNNIQINKINNISIVKQKINWITYFILNVLILLCFLFIGINIFFLIILLIISNGVGLLIGSSTKWILVEYFDQDKTLKKAYFADGSMFGWSGLFGGTQKIYETIKS